MSPRELIAALKDAETAEQRYDLIETAEGDGMRPDQIVVALAAWL